MKEDAPITEIKQISHTQPSQQILRSASPSSDDDGTNTPSPTKNNPQPPKDDTDAESIGGQRNTMSRKRMLLAFSALSVCLFVSFIDQTSVSTAVPAIAEDLDTGTATSWIGTSFLIASTAFQLINGRLSDIFGRVLGAVLALANGVGPFVGGAVVQESTWRWVFWMVPIISAPAAVTILFCLPLKHRPGNYSEKVKKIDYGGIALNMASTLLLLIPLSGGGVTYPWSSPFVIAGVVVGAVLAALFVLYEWKLAKLPIMPLRLYQAPHCSALFGQTFLMGQAYFGNLFYLPIYFQSILNYEPLVSGALILPVIITTSGLSILSGQYMLRVGRYMPCILAGFFLWTLGNGLTILFDRDTGLEKLIPILVVVGAGIGLTLQPTLVGMYANSRAEDRAVTTGLRNFIRTIGGAFGLVVSGVILSNTLRRDLHGKDFVSDAVIAELTSSTYTLDQKGFSDAEKAVILEAYMKGLHYIFVYYVICSGLSLVLTLGVGNTGLKAKKAAPTEEASEGPKAVSEDAPMSDQEKASEKASEN
ncbi:hypothetical protein COL5a_002393 [Colletotrichum fioriniae]|nr:uncharacterized protein COL516b_001895 [Colletotrichum fioriniae]KAJ0311191.1 hypothetical protein COL516b_001895 [Colletotrichum fioriniae]KAJ0331725.1 hypothetical protein COL5a_002393 [Colletotrichum fioriniae]